MGGSSGGGSSGAVSWPSYLQEYQANIIDGDTIRGPFDGGSSNLDELGVFHAIIGSRDGAFGNPYNSPNYQTPYNPTTVGTVANGSLSDNIADELAAFLTESEALLPGSPADIYTLFGNIVVNLLTRWDTIDESDPSDPTYNAEIDIPSDWADPTSGWSLPTTVEALSYVTPATTAMSDMLDDEVADQQARFQAGMANLGAAFTSAFAVGLALIESAQTKKVAEFEANLRQQIYNNKDQAYYASLLRKNELETVSADKSNELIAQAYLFQDKAALEEFRIKEARARTKEQSKLTLFQHYLYMLNAGYEASKSRASLTGELGRINYLIIDNYHKRLQDDTVAKADWELDVFQHGANMLAAVQGGTRGARTDPPKSNPLAGALSGAAMGAQVGTAAGNPAAGAVIGGLVGLGASLFG